MNPGRDERNRERERERERKQVAASQWWPGNDGIINEKVREREREIERKKKRGRREGKRKERKKEKEREKKLKWDGKNSGLFSKSQKKIIPPESQVFFSSLFVSLSLSLCYVPSCGLWYKFSWMRISAGWCR